MSEKLPRVNAKQVEKALAKKGFILVRQTGSHRIYMKHTVRVTVPFHGKKTLHPKLIKHILSDMDVDVDEFRGLL